MEEIKKRWNQERKKQMEVNGKKYEKKVNRIATLGATSITLTLLIGVVISVACSQTSQGVIIGLITTTLLATAIFASTSFYVKRQSSKLMANLNDKQMLG